MCRLRRFLSTPRALNTRGPRLGFCVHHAQLQFGCANVLNQYNSLCEICVRHHVIYFFACQIAIDTLMERDASGVCMQSVTVGAGLWEYIIENAWM